jgi:hypothetical protein
MAFSVSKSRPFRSLGLYKSAGKHAAPKGFVPEPRQAAEASHSHRPAHAATMPRLTGPHTDTRQTDPSQAGTGQQAA